MSKVAGMDSKILFVDDDAFILRLIEAYMEGEFQVALAGSAGEALAMIETHGPFRVVVSDYEMPGMKGVELLCQVARRWPDTLRILMSGGAMDMDRVDRAVRAGCVSEVLAKPFCFESLCERLRDELQERETARPTKE